MPLRDGVRRSNVIHVLPLSGFTKVTLLPLVGGKVLLTERTLFRSPLTSSASKTTGSNDSRRLRASSGAERVHNPGTQPGVNNSLDPLKTPATAGPHGCKEHSARVAGYGFQKPKETKNEEGNLVRRHLGCGLGAARRLCRKPR